MRINHLKLIILITLILGCKNRNQPTSIEERSKNISKIHTYASKNLDSIFPDLKKSEKLIALGGISDSLKGENDFFIGIYYANNGKQDSAAIYFQRATNVIKKPITYQRHVVYFNYAYSVLLGLGEYGDCLALCNRFETLLDDNAKDKWESFLRYMEENIYIRSKDYENAIKSNAKRLEIFKKESDTVEITKALLSQARSRYYLKDKKKAFAILDNLVEKETVHTNDNNRKLFGDYANYLSKEKVFDKSLKYYLKSLSYIKKINNSAKNRSLASSYSNIAGNYINLKEYNLASKYIDSVKTFNLNNMSKTLQRKVLKHQLRLGIADQTKSRDVIDQLDSMFVFQNDLYKKKYDKELAALTIANEKEKVILQEKQAAEIQSLKLQTRQQFLFLALGLIAIAGYLFFRQRKLGFERQQLQMQQRLLRSQMNPHFTSNILYSIQNLVKTTPEAAGNYLVKFSRLLRLVLENSMSNYVQLEDELETLRKYLDLQSLRYDSKFSYEFILNNLEEDDMIFIPPMLIQPIVENSIEHGLLDLDRPGKLKIILNKNNKTIECIVEDNGKGIIDGKSSHKQSASTKLINDFLRKTTKSELKVINKADINDNQTGVLVTFLIPFKLTEDD